MVAGRLKIMIELTRLDGSKFILNSDLIETIEAKPDTIITLINGKLFVVKESIEEIKNKVISFRKLIFQFDLTQSQKK